MCEINLFIRQLPHAYELELPSHMTAQAAGMDVYAAVDRPLVLLPGKRVLVPTGLQAAIPAGYEIQVRPRSGLAIKSGIAVLNSPGTVDADYRGEIKIILANLGTDPFIISRGDRIAQLIVSKVVRAKLTPCGELPETSRGEGGFGHTGV